MPIDGCKDTTICWYPKSAFQTFILLFYDKLQSVNKTLSFAYKLLLYGKM